MKKIIIAFLILFGALSCEYSLTDKNFHNINNEAPPLEIEFQTEDSLVHIWKDMESTYNYYYAPKFIVNAQRNIRSINILIDDIPAIYITYDSTKHTKFQVHNNMVLPYGTYDMTIEVIVDAGTGSLADMMGMEHFFYSKTFKAIYDAEYVPQNYLSVTHNDYLLKVKWNKYEGTSFKHYNIYKKYDDNHEALIQTIDDIDQTSFIDSSYTFGYATYTLETVTENSSARTNSKQIYYYPEYIKSVKRESWRRFIFDWDFKKYISLIDHIEITLEENGYNETIKNPGNNGYTFKYEPFSDEFTLSVRVTPKVRYYEKDENIYQKGYQFYYNRNFFPKFEEIFFFNNDVNKAIATIKENDNLYLFGLDLEVRDFEQKVLLDQNYPVHGYDIREDIGYLVCQKDLRHFNINDLNDSYIVSDQFTKQSDLFNVSENGKVAVYDNGCLSIYDLDNRKIIARSDPVESDRFVISEDGSYVFDISGKYYLKDLVIYRVENDKLIKDNVIPSIIDFKISESNPGTVYFRDENIIKKYSLDSKSIESLTSPFYKTYKIYDIDDNHNELVVNTDQFSYSVFDKSGEYIGYFFSYEFEKIQKTSEFF